MSYKKLKRLRMTVARHGATVPDWFKGIITKIALPSLTASPTKEKYPILTPYRCVKSTTPNKTTFGGPQPDPVQRSADQASETLRLLWLVLVVLLLRLQLDVLRAA